MNTEKEMMAMTAGEALSSGIPAAIKLVERVFDRPLAGGWMTLDTIRHKRMTLRRWELLIAVQRGRGKRRQAPALPFMFGTIDAAIARNFAP